MAKKLLLSFDVNESVKILPLQNIGFISEILISNNGVEYLVTWLDGYRQVQSLYLVESQLEKIDVIVSSAKRSSKCNESGNQESL